jgi:hypothetical protein
MFEEPIEDVTWTAFVFLLIAVVAMALFFGLRDRFARLRADLQRPAGGWTVGLLTLLGVFVSPVIVLAQGWPQPVAWIAMFVCLGAHIGWGAHGYHPRGMR